MSRRPHPPYGVIEQRELERLRHLAAADGRRSWQAAILAIVALRVRADPGGRITRDGFASLGRWVGVSPDTMRRAVHWLVTLGIVIESRHPARRHGGRQGAAWAWPRTVVPFDQWPLPPEERSRSHPSSQALPTEEASAQRASSVEKSHATGGEEPSTERGRAMQTPSDNPRGYPEITHSADAASSTPGYDEDAGYDFERAQHERRARYDGARRRKGLPVEVDRVGPIPSADDQIAAFHARSQAGTST